MNSRTDFSFPVFNFFQTGEGGIILLPGASLDESFTEDEDDWLKSLEGPPSPCDVTFINDNVLIDGKSSLSQKSRMRQKVRYVYICGGIVVTGVTQLILANMAKLIIDRETI